MYLGSTRSHLESVIASIQLLRIDIRQTHYRVLEDFKVILETVLGQSRIILVVIVLERENSERTALSFACPTATTHCLGRPALIVEREQIEFLREMHFPWT